MRFTSAIAVLFVVACATPPPPKPVEPPPAPAAPPPPVDPLVVTDATLVSQTLLDAVVKLELQVAGSVSGKALSWHATAGERDLGTGPLEVSGGAVSQNITVSIGTDAASLAAWADRDVIEVVVELKAGEGDDAVTRSRVVRVRSPRIPAIEIRSVQASQTGPAELPVTFLLSFRNPNPFEVRLGSLRYTAFLDGKNMASGELPMSSRVPASSENMFEIPGEANPTTVGKDIVAMLRKNELPWAFTGFAKVGGIDLPIDLKGIVKLSR